MNRVIISAAIVLILGAFFTCQGQTRQKLTPKESFSAIKKAAEETVNSDSAALKNPEFEYDEKEKLLKYYLGGVRVESFKLAADDPYSLPFEKEFQIELLRRLFKSKAPAEEFWVAPLDRAEKLVLETLQDIQNTADKATLKNRLDRRQEQFDEAFGLLHQSIRDFAKSKGYTAKRVGPRGLASDSFPVPVIKDPANGTVRVLPLTKYVMCNDLKLCGNNWPWRQLVSETENMIGEYFYEADWGGGRRNDGRIEVRNSSPITFRPRP